MKKLFFLITVLVFCVQGQITDERVKDFSNENLRTISESLRVNYENAKNIIGRYYMDISSLVPNTSTDTLVDGRDSDGVVKVSGSDIVNIITSLEAFIAFYEVAGRENVIEKFNVRFSQ